MRPHILITAEAQSGLRSVADLRAAVREGHGRQLWTAIEEQVDADLGTAPILPSSLFPGRDAIQAKHANRDYTVCAAAGQRILRAVLAHLISGRGDYRDLALEQIESLLDAERWPEWRDMAHGDNPADLRTGMLAHDVGLAYDWLHSSLTAAQRGAIVEGIDRCAIQPFWRSVEREAWWTYKMNNWLTCVVGGLGIAGMALGEDHPDAQKLVDYSLPRLQSYLAIYGPEGEFNESVAYANATILPADYFAAYRYHTCGGENLLGQDPFPAACRWMIYLTFPPGRVADFGDAQIAAPPMVQHFAAVAAATRDPILQWFYLQHAPPVPDPRQLLWYDHTLESLPPQLPLGKAFSAHGACISSRTDWDSRSTACVVYGKAGRETNHENDDSGQLCIDGYGHRLIVDPGSPSIYPVDFFGAHRRQYYNASVRGHNLLLFGDREMRNTPDARGRILHSEFDDARGACWQLDLTAAYEGVSTVRRTVVHLLPGVIAVLDEAELENDEPISLRWHTSDRCTPDDRGRFTVASDDVHLSARILSLDSAPLRFARREHEYRAPYDQGRMGDLLEQRRESYVETTLTADSCRLLTLFALFGPGVEAEVWIDSDAGWQVYSPDGLCRVSADDDRLTVSTEDKTWQINL